MSAPIKPIAQLLAAALPTTRPGTVDALAEKAIVYQARAGEVITRQGERHLVGLVLEGFVALIRTTVEGRQTMPRIARAGQLCVLLPMGNRSAGADSVALSTSTVALWPSETIRRLANDDAKFALDTLDLVLEAFDAVVEGLDGLLHQNALRRVARVLHLYHPLFFGDEPVLTRAHLPILVGTSREMTGRVLRRLDTLGLVKRAGRNGLRLLDSAGLERLATAHQADSGPSHVRNKFLGNVGVTDAP
jgi:CRP-like cAMP-binding protein